jgi:hypothetical protein
MPARHSTRRRTARFLYRPLAVAALFAVLGGASAEDDVAAWAARHPAGSIRTVEAADDALREAEAQRQSVEARYFAEQNECYDRFFVSRCLEQAAERHRVALQRIRPIEIEANTWKRRAKVDERDRNLELQREKNQEEARERAAQQRQRDAETAARVERNARAAEEAAAKSRAHEGQAGRRVAEHEARLRQKQAEEAANAELRARKVEEFEEKKRASEARQRELAATRAEKEKRRAEREGAATPTPKP